MKHLSIGQLADLECISRRTLRFYQEKGLLDPLEINEDSGTRVYEINQLSKLDMIAHLKSMGLSLDDIKAIDDKRSVDALAKAAENRIEEIDDQIQDLMIQRSAASELKEGCEAYLEAPAFDIPMLEILPTRRILEFPVPRKAIFSTTDRNTREAKGDAQGEVHTDRESYAHSDQWDQAIHSVKKTIVERGWPPSLFRNVCSRILVAQKNPAIAEPHSFFVFVNEAHGPCYEESVELNGGPHVVIYFNTSCNEKGDSQVSERLEKLKEHARLLGYKMGDSFFIEPLFRYERLFNGNYGIFSRYCLPIMP